MPDAKLIDADKAPDVKALTLHLLLIVTTASDNINLNSMIPYLLTNEVFEALVQLLVDNSLQISPYTVLLLTAILSNYHKYELLLFMGLFIAGFRYESKNIFHDRLPEISQPAVIDVRLLPLLVDPHVL